jgi:hypothetical protein
MNVTEATTAVFSLIGIAIILKLVDVWQHYRVAAVREDLFEMRDVLFDIGQRNSYLFRHPSYVRLRQTINICIRFAHKFTGSRLVGVLLMRQVWSSIPKDNWMETLQGLPKDVQAELMQVHKRVHFRLGCHLLHMPMRVAWTLLNLIKRFSNIAATRAKEEIADKVELLESQAAEEFEMETCAAGAGAGR